MTHLELGRFGLGYLLQIRQSTTTSQGIRQTTQVVHLDSAVDARGCGSGRATVVQHRPSMRRIVRQAALTTHGGRALVTVERQMLPGVNRTTDRAPRPVTGRARGTCWAAHRQG